ncbi:dihydropteroate synthase [Gemmatimonadota bacterium]
MTGGSAQAHRDAGTVVPEAPGPRARWSWRLRDVELDLSGPVVMGILNLTPDSFSDGGELVSVGKAMDRARGMVADGAGILDIGGESTRPGASPVSPQEEMGRVLPFLSAAVVEGFGVPISVDTRSATVAREALRSGAQIVNDVSGLRHDEDMARVAAEEEAGLVLSHMRGTPATMKELADYGHVVHEVREELEGSLALALEAGIDLQRIVVDPGIGFAKTGDQSLTLLRELDALGSLGCPVMVGPSRKSFLGEITGAEPRDRLPGTLAACVLAYGAGARVFRVHDVGESVQALAVARAIMGDTPREERA